MSGELLLLVKCALTGFVGAGLIGSFYQLITNRPARFVTDFQGFMGIVAASLFCAATGPVIIMRNAIRGRRIEQRPLGWLAASSAIAFFWSVCSGVLMLYVLVSVSRALA